MQTSRNVTPLALGTVLLLIAASMLALFEVGRLARELLQILVIIAGAAFFSGLWMLLGYTRQPGTAPLIQITFDGARLRHDLEEVIDAEFSEVGPTTPKWEPVPSKLVLEDPALALAKVRIDLERELRRLAIERDISRPDQRFDMLRTLVGLEQKKLLPSAAVTAIRDILPICNRALHGEPIDAASAREVVDVAAEVMVILSGAEFKHYP